MRLFSTRDRPVHLGPYPLERLARQADPPDVGRLPSPRPRNVDGHPDVSLAHAIAPFHAIFDAIRDGPTFARSEIPSDPAERTRHLKAACYYFDATQVGICRLPPEVLLDVPVRNAALDALAAELSSHQPKTLAAGIDVIMADVRDAASAPPAPIDHHGFAIVVLVEHPREPSAAEPGGDWIVGTTAERSAVRAAETAATLANYLRVLGFSARSHTVTTSEVNLARLAVLAGLGTVAEDADGAAFVTNPYVGPDFALAAITTELALAPDQPLAERPTEADLRRSHGLAWRLGRGTLKNAADAKPYAKRPFHMGAFPFETIRRVEAPTTFIDEARVARVPKRTDMFARALFGDMGQPMQEAARNGMYLLKNPIGYCPRRPLGALILRQDGEPAAAVHEGARDPQKNADSVKAALYFLGADAVGISRCPDWAYYSHDATGAELAPYHPNAISILIDQGHETMEGASGDDWISGAQSMRAYLRGSLLGGILAEQIRRLGYGARVHSVLDGEVLQPPLLLLSGLGEVSRIGEVILNPFLGPRLKSAVVTTDMPLTFDKPIDFGLQRFCESCNKCARECPSGAITAGPKLMFNGYEIWKSDSEKCARYRLTNTAGSMCGRCMKTCPWNLEGLFQDAVFRWAAINLTGAAPLLAKLDDRLGRGAINPVKTWWWDLSRRPDGSYGPADQVNRRGLTRDLDLRYEDQVLAVYPAPLAPHPWPFPFAMDREAGIAAYEAMVTPAEYRDRLARGETVGLSHTYTLPLGDSPVIPALVTARVDETPDLARFEISARDGAPLPPFEAGAHVDVVVAPEFFRQYSLAGDPADPSRYVIAVLREEAGRGGSKLMHRIFRKGRRIYISRPINHFPLVEDARLSLLFGGGIGVTPMIAMAHRLDALGADFALHYSVRSRRTAGFLGDIAAAPWRDRVTLHVSDEGSRAAPAELIPRYAEGVHIYTCGPDRYMSAVIAAAERAGFPDDAIHREYFSVPEVGDYENHAFVLKLVRSGREITVPADRSATEALAEAGIHVDTKCSDGICGVCATRYVGGEVEHRDFMLSNKQRADTMLLCCSRAAAPDGAITLDL